MNKTLKDLVEKALPKNKNATHFILSKEEIYQIAERYARLKIEEIKTKKFKIGERLWCIKCANNIVKELKQKYDKR